MKMNDHHQLRLLLSVLIIIISATASSSLSPDEMTAAKELRNSLAPLFNSSFLEDPCTWPDFVKCEAGHITQMYIKDHSTILAGKTLPSTLSNLKYLTQLHLMNNELTGPIPTLNGFDSLVNLYLNNNNFTSLPPDCFDGMTNLQRLAIDYNPSLSAWPIPTGLRDANALTDFTADSANINGTIPSFLGELSALTTLHLSFNYLQGGLPETFATSSSSIESLWLNSQNSPTKLNGTVTGLQSMTSLTVVWLHGNNFTGPLPDFSALTNLQDLSLRDNQLTGPVPVSLINLQQLKTVNLTNNHLQGPTPQFPKTVGVDMTGVNSFCNQTAGAQCDPLVTTLLAILEPWGYPLSLATAWQGNAPCSSSWRGIFCKGNNITKFDLSRQGLSGIISPIFSNLTSLQSLNLSKNNLTGTIPTELVQLTQLKQLDLSNNNLYGEVPSFGPDVIVKYDGNPNIGKDFPSSSSGDRGHKAGLGLKVGLPICIFFVLVLAVGIGKYWSKIKAKHLGNVQKPNSLLRHPSSDQGGEITTTGVRNNHGSSGPNDDAHLVDAGQKIISIRILKEVTDNFSEVNILGRGGFGTVYKGGLHDGTKIAVKRMEPGKMGNKGLDEFTSEISVLTKVRHRHLVNLLGYCVDEEERLLVFEYLPQGTLSKFLFHWKEEGLKPLEWARRLIIALDVARGVEYLHGLARQSFIHRDLKPSNILLGDDMRAKVADFGLVKLAPDDKASFATRIAGTFGYLAPEYAVTGRVTTKVDVYSFGVILMELITGRKALDDSQPEDSIHLVSWFRRVFISKDMFPKAIDPAIELDEETLASVSTVAELAGHCSAREPHQRPDMNHAVNVLSSLTEFWRPSEPGSGDAYGIDPDMTLPQALQKWQATLEDDSYTSSAIVPATAHNTQSRIPSGPSVFVTSLKSLDGR